MKKTLFLIILVIIGISCEKEQIPMKMELYPKKVYIVGTRDQLIHREIELGNPIDTINLSVAISGSLPLSKDVTVTLEENSAEVNLYNQRNVSGESTQFQKLSESVYSYPLDKVVIKAGEIYNVFPIHIETETLHCDSLYMIPLRLKTISDYELSDNDTTVLVRLHLKNKYSGLYYVDGILKNTVNTDDSVRYKMTRTLIATDNGTTVRMYHYNNETKDYLPTHTIKISINDDNSLSFSTWDEFIIYDGGGTYYPEMKLYDFWYEYDNNGTRWRAKGVLYKERETSAEQEKLDDWLDDYKKDNP